MEKTKLQSVKVRVDHMSLILEFKDFFLTFNFDKYVV